MLLSFFCFSFTLSLSTVMSCACSLGTGFQSLGLANIPTGWLALWQVIGPVQSVNYGAAWDGCPIP